MTIRNAACCCGQLTLVAEGEPVRISMCHCLACQRRTGSPFGAQARFPRDKVRVEGSSTAYARTGDTGSVITFHFCPKCGSTIYCELEKWPDFTVVPLGAFADPSFPAPTVSIYEARRHSWTGIPEGADHLD